MIADPQLALPGVSSDSLIEWVWSEEEGEVNVIESFVHATVMQGEVVDALEPRPGGIYVDATAGGGGHIEAICERAPGAKVIGLDRDEAALAASEKRLEPYDGVVLVKSTFSRVAEVLTELGVGPIDGLCADLGVSSPQLDDPLRGMSFRRAGPIDMRMDTASGETAKDLIGRLDDDELADVIFKYGDERRSRRIARSIKKALEAGELDTTLDLRRSIVRAVGPVRVGGVDPATRTFQALRIAVNRELEELETLLAALPSIIKPGGAVAILTFHSLEDRLVKRAFADRAVWKNRTKKPLPPTDLEREQNPRSRSAKLRSSVRLEAP